MRKIPTLFVRSEDDRLVMPVVMPGCEWVIAGEGVATRKWDGTCCLMRAGKLFKRYELQPAFRCPPPGFEPATEVDPKTGKQQGWVPVGDGPEDCWHREAFLNGRLYWADGTYELCGPKVQGNPEGLPSHFLIPHGVDHLPDCPRDFEGLKAYLGERTIEGVVFWRAAGDPSAGMVKIKRRDFFKPERKK